MKLITSEIEAEADKWNEPQNQIVKVKIILYCNYFLLHMHIITLVG